MFLENELRLIWTLLLNAAVVAAAYRYARRWGSASRIQAACDALLALFVVEYLAVALPGIIGVFNAWSMTLVAAVACAAMWWFGRDDARGHTEIDAAKSAPRHPLTHRRNDPESGPSGVVGFGFLACSLFLTGYIAVYAYDQRWLPPLSTDPLVYHLPTAVQWIQTGRLGLFPTWYWNPAATYSPATSSTFMAWLMAPMRNDALVRYVQAPALLLIFLVVARLCRLGGCNRTVAGLIGAATALSRPFFSEAMFAKDDLFITAFFGCAVIAAASDNLRDRLGPWRAGLALGMVLASKYTILMACPLFIFLIDAPFRAKWKSRDWIVAVGIALALSLPWYLRNVWLKGNPLYPVDVKFLGLQGMFTTERDQTLRSAGGIKAMLSATYHSMPIALLIVLLGGWLAALLKSGKRAITDPLRRAALIGTPVTLVIFLITSPHHEVRYLFPFFVMLFAATGWAISGWIRSRFAQMLLCAIIAAASLLTAFDFSFLGRISAFSFEAGFIALSGLGIFWVRETLHRRNKNSGSRIDGIAMSVAAAIVAMLIYAFWPTYLRLYDEGTLFSWQSRYEREADLWTFVRENIPADATISIANTSFVYPLYGFRYERQVTYAPIRRGLHQFDDMPRLGDKVPGDLLVDAMTLAQNTDPDRETWLANLRARQVGYLLIHKSELVTEPPELKIVAAEPSRFRLLFESKNGVIYQFVDG